MKRYYLKNSVSAFIAFLVATPLFAGPGIESDTAFKKTNPNLIYTTRDYFISIDDGCNAAGFCLKDFSFILTFNVGVDLKQNIKQIGFHSAYLDFNSRSMAAQSYIAQDFDKYTPISSQDGWAVNITFYPDALPSGQKAVIQKCIFNGVVQQRHIAGKITFYTSTGTYEVIIN